MTADDRSHLPGLGAFIRSQRRLAELSQRELARLTELSDAYLSQLERGLHEPSVRVLRSIANALNIPATTLMRYAGLVDEDEVTDAETAIRSDPRLTTAQKSAMLEIYRGFTVDGSNDEGDA